MPGRDKHAEPPLEPLESDKDLFRIPDLRRDDSAMKRFSEAIVEDAERLKTADRQSGSK